MYIEINLLPREFRPKKALIKLDYRFLFTLVIIFAALGIAGYYYHLQRSIRDVKTQRDFLLAEERKIQEAVKLNLEVKDIRNKIEKRINIIKELTSDSDVLFAMLDHINLVIPENLWLISIKDASTAGRVIYDVEGMSYSKDDISEFLASLEKFDKFSNVSLESIAPAPFEIRDAYRYIVKVELAVLKPSPEEEEQRASRGRRRR